MKEHREDAPSTSGMSDISLFFLFLYLYPSQKSKQVVRGMGRSGRKCNPSVIKDAGPVVIFTY